jgi:alpha-beta hydrolase superfamily lysophospholipase
LPGISSRTNVHIQIFFNRLTLSLAFKAIVFDKVFGSIRFLKSMQKLSIQVCMILFFVSGCSPMIHPPAAKHQNAQITSGFYQTEDGASLPLHQWLPENSPTAVVVALHGFNDYGTFFDQPGNYLREQGIASFAYDQRGFGGAPMRGYWAGLQAYTDDLRVFIHLLKNRYPRLPLYVLGESMGGAVIIAAAHQAPLLHVAGTILVAPAIWARKTMPWYQSSLLAVLAHTLPRMTLTGESVGVQASDNIEMLRALGRDPLIIKKTRVEAIYGLTNLMDAAFNGAGSLNGKTLLLYGEKDEIIPKKPTYQFLQRLLAGNSSQEDKKIAFYSEGYHMLLRDLNASVPWRDILFWMNNEGKALPSKADSRALEILAEVF